VSETAEQRGWGNPDRDVASHIARIEAGGVAVSVHEGVADIFRYLLTSLARVYDLAGFADDWGYCNRDIRGRPGVKSNHSWGLALDLDATVNPMTKDLQAGHEFARPVVDPILAHFGGRLVWGGEYASARKDYMHFEYVAGPGRARIDSITARDLLANHTPTEDDVTPQDIEAVAQRVLQLLKPLVATHQDMKTLLRGDSEHLANLTSIAKAVGVKGVQ
jgi:hypothetical protein